MKQRISVLAASVAMMAAPAVAQAQDQPWLRDRSYTEGIGYRAGDFELHPGLAAEFGYDSNYFRRALEEKPVGSLRLRITPSLSLSTLSGQRRGIAGGPPPDVEFRAALSATYNEFFPVSGDSIPDREKMSQQRNVGANLDLGLTILPSRPWSGNIYAKFLRDITASPQGLTGDSFNRIIPRAGAELIWTPGSGLLDWRLGYEFIGTFFESGRYAQISNFNHELHTRGRWRFLPRTALMYDAHLSFINYPSTATTKTASHPLHTLIGINGLVTSSFSLLALAGWGASFYTPAPQEDFNSVIGQLELKWYITPNPSNDPAAAGLSLSTLAVGFVRDFYDSYIGTYFERDRGYANLSYFFAGRFLVVVEGGAGPIVYPAIPGLNLAPFTDIRLDASLFGEYRIKNAFGINATVRYGQNISNTTVSVAGSGPDSLAWQQFEAYLGARWLM
jgi:hypothetical protein